MHNDCAQPWRCSVVSASSVSTNISAGGGNRKASPLPAASHSRAGSSVRCAGHAAVDMGANIVRAFRNFNVESRAHRLIGRDKPSAAPLHPGTKEALQAATSNHPDIQEKIHKKDSQLLSHLKDVYVDSRDPTPLVNVGRIVAGLGAFGVCPYIVVQLAFSIQPRCSHS
ncbi:hypothetical protein GDO81_007983 [Engystomops pustulosus]|uniref:NADH dehydrogenase [ubiquinone] 1 alpha subcomplex assembly factor 4 n=1 Tax=Engystomops pustulosus TaxID=76066 RepID=A0AAV7CD43_ENGPU|nr:hypothetical protein GDO81_007983 [Engystomops pustulosus]